MPYTVTLAPDHTAFTVETGEPILAAAKRQNLNLPHSCQNGICGQCKAEVLSGQVNRGSNAASVSYNQLPLPPLTIVA